MLNDEKEILFNSLMEALEHNDVESVKEIVPSKIEINEKVPISLLPQINHEFNKKFKEISIPLLAVLYDAHMCLPYLISFHHFSSRVIRTAIELDHILCLQKIIESQKIDANAKGSSKRTFLAHSLNSSIPMFRLVLSLKKLNINEKCEDGNTAVLLAARKGLIQQFIILAQSGADLKATNDLGECVVHMALMSKNQQMLSEVLKWDVDVNCVNKIGLTPLLYAIRTNDAKGCEILTKHKDLDINRSDKMGVTPLHQSISNGTHFLTEILLNIPSIDVNKPDSTGNTPLHYACKKDCNISVALLASKQETDLNPLNKDKKTPLEIACERKAYKAGCALIVYDDVEVYDKVVYSFLAYYLINDDNAEGLKCLFRRGVDFRKISINNTPPLLVAVSLGRVEALRAILSYGQVDINARGKKSNATALHIACTNSNFPFIITRLLTLHPSIDINALDEKGNTPLYMAIYRNCQSSADLLLELHDIEVDIPNKMGNTPIMAACMKNNIDIGLKLIETGCNLGRINNEYLTPLMIACKNNNIAMVKLLIKKGNADPFMQTEAGTAFTISLKAEASECISYLLKIKAYDRTYEEDGQTIFDMARKLENQQLREFVLAKL